MSVFTFSETLQRAVVLLEHGHAEQALRRLARIDESELNPDQFSALSYWRSVAFASLGAADESEEAARQGLARDGIAHENEANLHDALAHALMLEGKQEDAFEHFHRATLLDPNDSLHWYRYGAALARAELDVEAGRKLRKAFSIDRTHEDTVRALVEVLHRSGKKDAAIRIIEQHFDTGGNSPALYAAMGILFAVDERWEEANRCFEHVIARAPEDSWVLFNWAIMLTRQGRIAQAMEHAQRAVQLNERYPPALALLGEIEFLSGRIEVGLDRMREALDEVCGLDDAKEEKVFCHEVCHRCFLAAGRNDLAEMLFWKASREDMLTEDMILQHNLQSRAESSDLIRFRVNTESDSKQRIYEVFASNRAEAVTHVQEFERLRTGSETHIVRARIIARDVTGVSGVLTPPKERRRS